MDNGIIFITAYKDIGRNTWSNFNRSNAEYFNNFILLCNNIKYTLLVYIENNIREQLLMEYSFNLDNIIFKDYPIINACKISVDNIIDSECKSTLIDFMI